MACNRRPVAANLRLISALLQGCIVGLRGNLGPRCHLPQVSSRAESRDLGITGR